MQRRILLSLVLATALLGCARGVEVETALDRRAPLASYETFAMMLPNDAIRVPGDVDAFKMLRVRQLTYGQLIARGFHAVEKNKADFVVRVNAGTADRVDRYTSRNLYGGGFSSEAHPVIEGTLVLEFVDLKKKAVVWHGRGRGEITSSTSDERIAELIGAVLQKFPPRK